MLYDKKILHRPVLLGALFGPDVPGGTGPETLGASHPTSVG